MLIKFLRTGFIVILCSFPVLASHSLNWKADDVYVLPEVGRKPWLEAINQAESRIQMAAYRLSDPQIVEALVKADQRGIEIDLLLEPDPAGHDKTANVQSPFDLLAQLKNIKVHQLSKRFNQAHYKMIIVDNKRGLIGTDNLDQESFDGNAKNNNLACRDFIIPILEPSIIQEIQRVFEADCKNERIVPAYKPLVWGPDFQRTAFLEMINSAQQSLKIYNQDIQDKDITQALIGALQAGVEVKILMMPYPFGGEKDKNAPNQNLIFENKGQVALCEKHYIHAKIIIVDNKLMYLGSGNMYPASIDGTRELGILTENPLQIATVLKTFEEDWKDSKIITQKREE